MTIFGTIIFYLSILFVCLFFASIAEKNNNKKLVFIIILLLTIVAGLRSVEVGFDTKPYMLSLENYYKTGMQMWPYNSFSNTYGIFVKFIYAIWHNYNFLLFIEAFIINYLIIKRFWELKEKSSFVFMIYLYLIVIYLRTFNLNLQYLAIALIFYSTRYLDKSKLKSFFFLIISSLLHTSAVIGFLYIFYEWLDFKNLTKKRFMAKMLFMGIIAVGFYLSYTMIIERYSHYFVEKESSIGLMSFAQIIVFIIIYVFSSFLYKNNDEHCIKKAPLYYFTGIIFAASSYFIGNAGRISYYFMIFEPVYYGVVIKSNKTSKYLKIFVVVWLTLYALYVLIDGLAGTKYFPYSFAL